MQNQIYLLLENKGYFMVAGYMKNLSHPLYIYFLYSGNKFFTLEKFAF